MKLKHVKIKKNVRIRRYFQMYRPTSAQLFNVSQTSVV